MPSLQEQQAPLDATYALDALTQRVGRRCTERAVYTAVLMGNDWTYQAEFPIQDQEQT